MAFDHYIAICIPLRYTTILTTPMVIKMGLFGVTRAILLVLPGPLLIKRLPYYTNYVINHAYFFRLSSQNARFKTLGPVLTTSALYLSLTHLHCSAS
ncbi:hypothetical protein HPG69_006215 [Diceros bicornis minor]|uniref:Uncharacterized protein n=1 Tax=Diceros bicornis minor TaxID=77932 RepID=A0A7J7F295_DICBM|nr:hypothetical protein HPG69_006215 [Diceros bicornis minor]